MVTTTLEEIKMKRAATGRTDIKCYATIYCHAQHFCVLMYKTALTNLRASFKIVAQEMKWKKKKKEESTSL